MSYELSFEPAELVKQYSLSDSFNIHLQNDDVQDLDVRWDQASLSASETFAEMVLEGFCMSKLQDSVQLQTVLGALYDQETRRNSEQPSGAFLQLLFKLFVSLSQLSPMHPSRQKFLYICLEVLDSSTYHANFIQPLLSTNRCPPVRLIWVCYYHSFFGLSVMLFFSIALVFFTDDTASFLHQEQEDETETRCVPSE